MALMVDGTAKTTTDDRNHSFSHSHMHTDHDEDDDVCSTATAAQELCARILKDLDNESALFAKPARQVAVFHQEEIRLGAILGQGEFGTVRDLCAVSLSQQEQQLQRELLHLRDSSSSSVKKLNQRMEEDDDNDGNDPDNNERYNKYNHHEVEKDGSADNISPTTVDRERWIIHERSVYESERAPPYAVKRVREDLQGEGRVTAALDLAVEARFLSALTHPNIVRMRGAAGQPGSSSYMIIMDRLYYTLEEKIDMWKQEKVPSRTRRLFLGWFSRRNKEGGAPTSRGGLWYCNLVMEIIVVAYDISRALKFLHQHNVIYRDLKPSNLGFDMRGNLKLFDLGLAKELKTCDLVEELGNKYDLTPITGTRRWMAPEVYLALPYNLKADVYSFGLMLWHLITLKLPFGANINNNQHFRRVIMGGKRPRIPVFVPNSMRQLMKRCWDFDPDVRPDLGAVSLEIRDEISRFKCKNGKERGLSIDERTQFLHRHSYQLNQQICQSMGLPPAVGNPPSSKSSEPSSVLSFGS